MHNIYYMKTKKKSEFVTKIKSGSLLLKQNP